MLWINLRFFRVRISTAPIVIAISHGWAGQGGEHMVAENAKLGAKNHQKEDAENRPDVEDNYVGLHFLKPRLNAEIINLYILI